MKPCALEWCENEFDPATSRPNRRFCSSACRVEFWTSRTVPCPKCNRQMFPTSSRCYGCDADQRTSVATWRYVASWVPRYYAALCVALERDTPAAERADARREMARLCPATRRRQQHPTGFASLIEAALIDRIDGR